VRRRGDAPSTFVGPGIVRRRPPDETGTRPPQEEAALPSDYYEHILYVVRAAGKAMERSPETYRGWSEPKRRDVLVLMRSRERQGDALSA
jgi:hypothetical protein